MISLGGNCCGYVRSKGFARLVQLPSGLAAQLPLGLAAQLPLGLAVQLPLSTRNDSNQRLEWKRREEARDNLLVHSFAIRYPRTNGTHDYQFYILHERPRSVQIIKLFVEFCMFSQ